MRSTALPLASATSTLTGWQHPHRRLVEPGAAELAQIVAVRIGIVTRSPTKEKPATPGDDNTCTATTTKPELFPATVGEKVEPGVADWKCYRYRTSIAVVPLRNLVLGM